MSLVLVVPIGGTDHWRIVWRPMSLTAETLFVFVARCVTPLVPSLFTPFPFRFELEFVLLLFSLLSAG